MPLRHLIVLIVDAHPSAEVSTIRKSEQSSGINVFLKRPASHSSTMVRSAPNSRLVRPKPVSDDPSTEDPRIDRTMPYSRCQTAAHGSAGRAGITWRNAKQIFADKMERKPPSIPRKEWWSQTGSNRRPHACKARALPTELWPQFDEGRARERDARQAPNGVPTGRWWAWDDSNVRPHPYQGCALTT